MVVTVALVAPAVQGAVEMGLVTIAAWLVVMVPRIKVVARAVPMATRPAAHLQLGQGVVEDLA